MHRKNKFYRTISLIYIPSKITWEGTSLVVQWLRLHAPNAEGQGTGSRTPHLRARVKIPHTAMKVDNPACHS